MCESERKYEEGGKFAFPFNVSRAFFRDEQFAHFAFNNAEKWPFIILSKFLLFVCRFACNNLIYSRFNSPRLYRAHSKFILTIFYKMIHFSLQLAHVQFNNVSTWHCYYCLMLYQYLFYFIYALTSLRFLTGDTAPRWQNFLNGEKLRKDITLIVTIAIDGKINYRSWSN